MQSKSTLSPLQTLKNGGQFKVDQKSQGHAAILPLTSLIDAFSIIVIYLLIGTQSGGIETNVSSQMQLPIAEQGSTIEKETSIVRIENGVYYINDQAVAVSELGAKLAALKGSADSDSIEILIQADRKMTYASLDPLLRAGSEAGIQKLKFAVTPEQ
jgi:biopolymer transport protein ExbD